MEHLMINMDREEIRNSDYQHDADCRNSKSNLLAFAKMSELLFIRLTTTANNQNIVRVGKNQETTNPDDPTIKVYSMMHRHFKP